MPIYTCTTAQGTLRAGAKGDLAAEITRIHAEINHVPPTYVNVLFSELPQDSVYVGGEPGAPLLISGWARRGHPQEETTAWHSSCRRRYPASPGYPSTASWW
ncbi:4-oxalocrotonate tautomerase family protein [Streptomyces sp. LN590]|uniref:tautomerase family protein n=1 Tax=unclassified Streptomyces TaxID=2593676 RepID=UPI00370FF302